MTFGSSEFFRVLFKRCRFSQVEKAGFRMAVRALLLLLPCVTVCAQTGEPSSVDVNLAYEKARKIVAEFTPERSISAKSFEGGLRIIGASRGPGNPAPETTGLTFTFKGPDYLKKDDLLFDLGNADAATLRLLWRREPSLQKPGVASVLLRLSHHQGYGAVLQKGSTRVMPDDYPVGTSFWTDHPFSLDRAVRGIYDVYAQTTSQPVETIPLGLLLVRRCETDAALAERVDSVFPEAATKIFSGRLSMTRWYSYRVEAGHLASLPRKLSVISSADWLEDAKDGRVLARFSVLYDTGARDNFDFAIGRDTSSTWYDYHNRGSIAHSKAKVAWTTPTEYETVTFDAATYLSSFDLTTQNARTVAVEIEYTAEEGILHLYGLALE